MLRVRSAHSTYGLVRAEVGARARHLVALCASTPCGRARLCVAAGSASYSVRETTATSLMEDVPAIAWARRTGAVGLSSRADASARGSSNVAAG